MEIVHISESEAIRNFGELLKRVREGAEVIIESGELPLAVLRSTAIATRTISESIARAEAYSKEIGYTPTMDEDFSSDLNEIVALRKPRDRSAWD